MNGRFVHETDIEREQLDWGGLGWISRPPSTGARQLTVLDVSLEPGHGHDFHTHPEQEEVIVVQAGLTVALGPCAGEGGYELVDVSGEEPWRSLRSS